MRRKILLGVLAIVVVLAGIAVWRIGPRNVIGMLLYDQRREGSLKVGDPAPDVTLRSLDDRDVRLLEHLGARPLVVIFGSYT
jgi:hypothetical protein